MDVLAYAGVALETCINIDINCRNGASVGKIAWDAAVDTAVLGVNTWISIAAGAAVGSMLAPGAGTVVGFVVGAVVGVVLDIISDDPRRYIKSWY